MPAALQLIGTPALLVDDRPLPLSAVDAALLALLALDGPASRLQAAALLWPDSPAPQPANNLRQRLFRLRRQAGNIIVGDRVLSLAPGVACDATGLEEGIEADLAYGPGELLAGLDTGNNDALAARLAQWRERFDHQRAACLAERAESLARAGRLADAIGYAERLVQHQPLAEHAHRRLMRLHHQRGDPAAARAAYERCRLALKTELGATPAPETVALLVQVGAAAMPAAPAPPPASLLRPPRSVGRDAARRAVDHALARGQVAVVWGEGGLGKSRLLGDVLAARPGWRIVQARPGDGALPYALLAAMVAQLARDFGAAEPATARAELARLVPSFGAVPTDAFDRLRLRQALAEALAGWHAAGLHGLAVDDLQFADAASLSLLGPLAGGAATLGWIYASRPWSDAPDWLAEAEPVLLQPLSSEQTAELVDVLALEPAVRDRLDMPDLLWRQSGGNPLALLQIVASRWEALRTPDAPTGAADSGIQRVVQARLQRLGAEARTLARVAAAAGPAFSVELAGRVLGVHPVTLADAVQELRGALMLVDNSFVHELLRDAIAQSTPPEVARPLHHDLARALAASGAPPAQVAAHFDAARQWEAAASAWQEAAAQAHARSAVVEELRALEAAARCAQAAGHDQTAFAAAVRCTRLLVATQKMDAALKRASALEAAASGPLQRAAALEVMAHVQLERREHEAALAAAREARALADVAGDGRLVLLALQREACTLMQLNRADEAAVLLTAAGPLEPLSPEERLQWHTDQAMIYDYADQRQRAIAVLDTVIDEAQSAGRLLAEAEAWSTKGLALMYGGRLAESQTALERSIACGRRAGMDEASVLIDEMSAIGHLRDLGRFDLYLARAEALPGALRAAGQPFWAANADNDLAVCWAWLGRADFAVRALATPLEGLPVMMRAARLLTRARLARDFGITAAAPRAGEPARLVHEAVGLLAAVAAQGRSYVRLRIALEAARELPPLEAAARAADIEAEAEARENVMLATAAALLRVRLLGQAGQHAAAAAQASAMLRRWARTGPQASIYAPELGWVASQAMADIDPAGATAALADAAAWITATVQRVPPPHRESFLHRNPVNAAVLQAQRRAALLQA